MSLKRRLGISASLGFWIFVLVEMLTMNASFGPISVLTAALVFVGVTASVFVTSMFWQRRPLPTIQ